MKTPTTNHTQPTQQHPTVETPTRESLCDYHDDLLSDIATEIDNRICELNFFSMAIPALFREGMHSDNYICGIFFALKNTVEHPEKTNKKINKAWKAESAKYNIEEVKS